MAEEQRVAHQKMKARESNIELLRIVAMLFVLVGHANGVVMGLPSGHDVISNFWPSLIRIFFMSLCIGGVNIFVLISGWFGIKNSNKGLGKFLFQIMFLLWSIYFIMVALGETPIDLSGVKISLTLCDEYWFVMGYLGLYILSPVLNAFAEKASKKQFLTLLISFYIYQCYYCWLTGTVNYFGGYSIVFFCGLYLTARYLRLYATDALKRNALYINISITILLTSIVLFSVWRFSHAMKMLRYDNPLAILSSITFLLVFINFKFQSRVVNYFAASSFAVYIVHYNPFVFKYFRLIVEWLGGTSNSILYLLEVFAFLLGVYVLCTFFDQLRIRAWKSLNLIFKSRC